MSQFEEIRKLGNETTYIVYSLCKDNYYPEVRCYMASWIEANILNSNLDFGDQTHHDSILHRMKEFCERLDVKAVKVEMLNQHPTSSCGAYRLRETAKTIRSASDKPKFIIDLFGQIKTQLLAEQDLLQNKQSASTSASTSAPATPDVQSDNRLIKYMEESTTDLASTLAQIPWIVKEILSTQKTLSDAVEKDLHLFKCISNWGFKDMSISFDNLPLNTNVSQFTNDDYRSCSRDLKVQVRIRMAEMLTLIAEKKQGVERQYYEIVNKISRLQEMFLQEIMKWNTQFFINVEITPLEILQKWGLNLFKLLLQSRNEYRALENALYQCLALQQCYDQQTLQGLDFSPVAMTYNPEPEIYKLLVKLIENSMVVEKIFYENKNMETQLGPVFIENKLFQARIRLLLGSLPEFNSCLQNDIHVYVLDDAMAKAKFHNIQDTIPPCRYEILEAKGELVKYPGDVVRIEFKKLKITEKRKVKGQIEGTDMETNVVPATSTNKKGKDTTEMDHRFWFLFEIDLTFENYILQVRAFSSPVRIVKHGNQVETAMSSIVWDNAAGPDMIGSIFPVVSFSSPLSILNLSLAINDLFISTTQMGLTSENLVHIRRKMERITSTPPDRISLKEFRVQRISVDAAFSFWTWMHSIVKLTVEHLCGNKNTRGPWQDGLIEGFTGSQEETIAMLTRHCNPRNFMLRFADRTLGGINIGSREHGQGFCVKAYVSKDLKEKSLASRIINMENLHFLRKPYMEKEKAFSKYLPQSEKTTNRDPNRLSDNGYVYWIRETRLLLPSSASCPSETQAGLQGDSGSGSPEEDSKMDVSESDLQRPDEPRPSTSGGTGGNCDAKLLNKNN